MKVVRLSAIRTGRLYPPGNIPGTHFCQRLSRPQGHSAAGRIVSTKNSSGTLGNRTHDLPACSSVPQPTAPPRSPTKETWSQKYKCCSVGNSEMRQHFHMLVMMQPMSPQLHNTYQLLEELSKCVYS